ncbi:MAG: 2,3-bisphosphoglycerate-independent phosphoglycerate mutase [Thermoplasmata archaeon]
MKKILLIILDGLGDRPSKELNFKTPLQAARKRNMDFLASNGIVGLMDPIAPGIRPGSDTSHLNLLGYDPYKIYTGRGPFEALGLGMDLRPGDIAFRGNFATVDDDLNVIDRRAGRIESGTDRLAESLNIKIDDVEILAKEGVEHRVAIVFRGNGLSPKITDTDPHSENSKVKISQPLNDDGKKLAEIVNEFTKKSYEILNNHPVNLERRRQNKMPANIVLLRGAGIVPELENFEKKYSLHSACIVGVPLISGICKLAGITPLKIKGVTGTINTDMEAKIKGAINALNEYDFVLVNIKATDIAGHDGNPILKRDVIERADKAMEPLRDIIDKTVIMITGDHSTPCSVKDHTGDPLPVLISSEGLRKDGIESFDEISAIRGSLRIRGSDVMNLLLNYSNRSEKFGA